MGEELNAAAIDSHSRRGLLERALATRLGRASERLASALREYAAVRRIARPGDPDWTAAQLKLAEARLRWRECADETQRLTDLLDGPDPCR